MNRNRAHRCGNALSKPAGWFSEPVNEGAGFPPGFVAQIVVDKRTGKFETDYARQQRIRAAGGWGTLPWAKT